MAAPKNWLCLITSDKEAQNVDELTRDVWTHFDGICAVIHNQGGDQAVRALLEARKREGFIKEVEWMSHHGHSMNHWLLDSRIHLMDCCWLRDSTERFNPVFSSAIKELSPRLLDQGVWNLAQYSKLLMFRRWFGQQFIFGIHWGLSGIHGTTIPIERIPHYVDRDEDYAYSVRNEKRPADHRLRHEVYYLLNYGANGNHIALFHKDPVDLENAYRRLAKLLNYLDEKGVHGVDEFGKWLKETWEKDKKLPDLVKESINAERPFRNYFRYYVLGHTNEAILKDEDVWRMEEPAL